MEEASLFRAPQQDLSVDHAVALFICRLERFASERRQRRRVDLLLVLFGKFDRTPFKGPPFVSFRRLFGYLFVQNWYLITGF